MGSQGDHEMRILAQIIGGIVLTSLFAYGFVKFTTEINKLWEKSDANRIDPNVGNAETSSGSAAAEPGEPV